MTDRDGTRAPATFQILGPAPDHTLWGRLVAPHPSITSRLERRQSRLLSAITLPLLIATALLLGAMALLQPRFDATLYRAMLSVGLPFLLFLGLGYLLSRSPYHEWGAYALVTAMAVGTWNAIALVGGTPYVTPLGFSLSLSVLLGVLFLPVLPVLGLAAVNLAGTFALPQLTGLSTEDQFLLIAFQVIAYPLFLVAALLRQNDLTTIEHQADDLSVVLENIPDPVLSLDPRHRLQASNRAARAELPAWFPVDLAGGDFTESLPESIRQPLLVALRKAPLEGRSGFEAHVDTPEGEKDLVFAVNGLRTLQDRLRGTVVMITDVTEQRRIERLERQAYAQSLQIEKLEDLNRFKTTLLNTASHEMSTPLTPIRLQLEILKAGYKGPLPPDQARAVDILDRNTQRLARLVEDILDVSRIESHRLTLHREPIDLASLVRDEVAAFRPVMESRGVAMDLECPDEAWSEGDPHRLGQVITNLLSNASKFTDEGGRIHVACQPGPEGVRISVTDTGMGIAEGRLSDLFKPFSQVHDALESPRGGSGLGLYICKGIVEGHGGTVGADSDGEGKGTRVWFTLPPKEA